MTMNPRQGPGTRARIGSMSMCFLVVVGLVGCSTDDARPAGEAGDSGGPAATVTVRLLAHDSWAASDGIFDPLLEQGIDVEVITGGDAGSLANSIVLDRENPQADVVYGVDNTFVGRALENDAFAVREYDLTNVVPELLAEVDTERIVPIDYGDVCVNFDEAWFAEREISPPTSIDDLIDSTYSGLTVVQDANLSSPGLAFLLATTERNPTGWEQWWSAFVSNDALVVPDWTTAWAEFSAGGDDGARPIVVSYASSPPVDVLYSDPPRDTTRIGVVDDGCFRQIEYAGVLRNARHDDAAADVVQFLLSERFQTDIPLNMFVWPSNRLVPEPDLFARFALHPSDPIVLTSAAIEERRDRVLEAWTDIVLS